MDEDAREQCSHQNRVERDGARSPRTLSTRRVVENLSNSRRGLRTKNGLGCEHADRHEQEGSRNDRVAEIGVTGHRLHAGDKDHGESDQGGYQPHGDIDRPGDPGATLHLLLSAAAGAVFGRRVQPRADGEPESRKPSRGEGSHASWYPSRTRNRRSDRYLHRGGCRERLWNVPYTPGPGRGLRHGRGRHGRGRPAAVRRPRTPRSRRRRRRGIRELRVCELRAYGRRRPN